MDFLLKNKNIDLVLSQNTDLPYSEEEGMNTCIQINARTREELESFGQKLPEEFMLWFQADDAFGVFYVKDTGKAISKEEIEKLLEKQEKENE